MSLGPSLAASSATVTPVSVSIQQSFNKAVKQRQQQDMAKQYYTTTTTHNNNSINNKYSYRTCPICSQKLLVRINGSFVYKWISTHFSTHHHEWMHVVVNLHES